MKPTCYLLIFMFSALSLNASFGQVDSVQQKEKSTITESVKKEDGSQEPQEWYDHKAWPWIASLIIAVITVTVNLVISLTTRRTSLSVVKSQIESSVKLARVQFQLTLNSKNRQDWINELRNCISEFATHARQLNICFQRNDLDDKRFGLHEQVFRYKSKIRLLLNNTKPQHTTYLDAQEALMKVFEIHLLNSAAKIEDYNNQDFLVKLDFMIEKGRELLYYEWQKVQKAQTEAEGI